tara:strand:+ start:1102 stop:1350 length:249 start_codon:yes stop_codon:yes gene_type:complete
MYICNRKGEMAEWSNAAVLKTVEGHTSGGSNPSFSAIVIPITFEISVLGIFYFLIVRYLYGIPVLKAKTFYQALVQTQGHGF